MVCSGSTVEQVGGRAAAMAFRGPITILCTMQDAAGNLTDTTGAGDAHRSAAAQPAWTHGRDITGRLVFLGTGTSVGVPVVGCGCGVCTSADPRDKRTRTSVAVGLPAGHLLIDTTPDLRGQLLRESIARIDAILYTHDHVDHVYGLDDLRPLCFATGRSIPLYCEERVENRIRKAFDYAFQPMPLPGGGVPKLEFARIGTEPFELLGCGVTPLRLRHGVFDVLGFRFGDVAYCTDTNFIPEETFERLHGLDVFIVDCLRPSRHPTHFSLEESLAAAERVNAKRTILIHLGHRKAFGTGLPDQAQPL
jgi:phosphoribosyl 1,2-cyclic phosphate phosphodiesterase